MIKYILIILSIICISTSIVYASFDINALTINGDTTAAKSTSGTTWTYSKTEDSITYSLYGTLFIPSTASATGTYPAVIVNHGGFGTANGMDDVCRIMRDWGMIAVATHLTHTGGGDSDCPGGTCLPSGSSDAGASIQNYQRIMKVVDILTNLHLKTSPYDYSAYQTITSRISIHGHSAGGAVVIGSVGSYPTTFKVASYTSSGYCPYTSDCIETDNPVDCCMSPCVCEGSTCSGSSCPTSDWSPHYQGDDNIIYTITPMSCNHGLGDTIVGPEWSIDMAYILNNLDVTYEHNQYSGYSHADTRIASDVLSNIQSFYAENGGIPSGYLTKSIKDWDRALITDKTLYVYSFKLTGASSLLSIDASAPEEKTSTSNSTFSLRAFDDTNPRLVVFLYNGTHKDKIQIAGGSILTPQ